MSHTARELRIPDLVVVEHEFQVPLDHANPGGESITVFARELADPDGRDRPYLVFFQGGPGHEAFRPTRVPPSFPLERILADHRMLLLDQRGTGRSTPVGALPGRTPAQQAEYLTHFRADSIVADAEFIRGELGARRWAVLGQSFGGFCVLRYLSVAPDSLSAAYITAGLPPIGTHVDEVYRATFDRVLERNRRFYERYPADRDRMREAVRHITADDVRLVDGDRLTGRRFRQAGNVLGMSDGAEKLHYLLETPFDGPAFSSDARDPMGLVRNPVYAVLHEAGWADGFATNWSAQRVLPQEYAHDETLFTGEHVFPWVFDDYSALHPLKEAAQILAAHEWPALYDADVLKHNEVPAAAAIWVEDAYVESSFSVRTAGQVRGLRPWITNEYEHNGLRVAGDHILDRLMKLAAGRV
jgi:pimeloyl-ACP methyl ester carboxylesterase